MAKVESKSIISVSVVAKDKNGKIRGSFELSSGNVYYYRANAKTVTGQCSYKQLIDFFEKKIVK